MSYTMLMEEHHALFRNRHRQIDCDQPRLGTASYLYELVSKVNVLPNGLRVRIGDAKKQRADQNHDLVQSNNIQNWRTMVPWVSPEAGR